AHAVHVARRGGLSQVLLRGPPARRVDDGPGSHELVEFLLRRPEVDQDDFAVDIEDDVVRLDVPVDDVPPVQIGEGLQQLEDVSGCRVHIGRLVAVSFRQGVPLELLFDEAERAQVGPFVQIPYDPRMAGRSEERRVGKEWRSRWAAQRKAKKMMNVMRKENRDWSG